MDGSSIRRVPVIARRPVICRKPVTKEWLAVRIARGQCNEHEKRLFHDSIINLIRKNALAYQELSKDDFEDLVQDCFMQVWKYLHTFNPKKAKLSTWTWIVCRSVLNSNFNDTQKYHKHICLSKEWDFSRFAADCPHASSQIDFQRIMLQLYAKFGPEHHDVLSQMFGSVNCQVMPHRIVVAEVARKTNRPYSDVHRFYNEKVRPFICQQLGVEGG